MTKLNADTMERGSAEEPGAQTQSIRRYTRLEAVERQLEMAVRARLQFDDPVSALTLAGAAEKVRSDLQPMDATIRSGYDSVKAFVNEFVKPERRRAVVRDIRNAYDQLRHADKLPNHTHELAPDWVDAFLKMAIYAHAGRPPTKETRDFAEWFYRMPPVLGAFLIWMFLNDPRGETWTRELENDPEKLNEFKSLPCSAAFEAILDLVRSKSLIPNP